MAIAIASIMQEGNTFSPVKTHYSDFAPVFGRDALVKHRGKLTEMGGFIDVLTSEKRTIEPVCAAWAITANRLLGPDFERLSSEFSDRLASVRKCEGLLFSMHGAQTADGVDDVEGFLLKLARRVLGPRVPIVVTLDLHANVTRAMVENCQAILGYHTYPHVDFFEVGQKAARLILRTLSGECRPAMAFRKLPLIVPAENMQTTSGPMHRLIAKAEAWESEGRVEYASVFGVQPWMDILEMGCTTVVVINGNLEAAESRAAELASEFWNTRREFDVRLTPVETAIRKALKIDGGPVVLSESSDSTGSGSPGDSTGVLKVLVANHAHVPSAIFLVDPEAVEAAHRAGTGATVPMRLGGKFDRKNSKPVKANAYVRMLSDGRWTPQARGYSPGIETTMGRAAVLEVGAIRILAAERSTMTVDPELFRSHAIEPMRMKLVVVKSPNGFRAAYEPIAKGIFIVDTPGVSTARLTSLPFRRVPRPLYPLDRHTRYEGVR